MQFTLDIFLMISCSYVIMSLAEYIAHRWIMHRPGIIEEEYYVHTKVHHGRFYKDFENDPDPLAKHVNIKMSALNNLFYGSPIFLGLWYFEFYAMLIVLASFTILHAWTWTLIHSEMHDPKGAWFSVLRLYKFYRHYHYMHHKDNNCNYNVVCPLMDFVFATFRWR